MRNNKLNRKTESNGAYHIRYPSNRPQYIQSQLFKPCNVNAQKGEGMAFLLLQYNKTRNFLLLLFAPIHFVRKRKSFTWPSFFFFTKQYVRSEGSKINPRQRDTFLEVCVIGKMIACYYSYI